MKKISKLFVLYLVFLFINSTILGGSYEFLSVPTSININEIELVEAMNNDSNDQGIIPNLREGMLEVVDKDGNLLGYKKRKQIHKDGDLHKAVTVIAVDKEGNVLVTAKSQIKDTDPLKKEASMAGHVDPGETSLGAAMREVKEEWEIKVKEDQLIRVGEDYEFKTDVWYPETKQHMRHLLTLYVVVLDNDQKRKLHFDMYDEENNPKGEVASGTLSPQFVDVNSLIIDFNDNRTAYANTFGTCFEQVGTIAKILRTVFQKLSEIDHVQSITKLPEIIDYFNEEGERIGSLPKKVVHTRGLINKHMICFVVNSERKLLVQKRSPNEDNPDLWDKSIGGHIQSGEPIETCFLREFIEELHNDKPLTTDVQSFIPIHEILYQSHRLEEDKSGYKDEKVRLSVSIAYYNGEIEVGEEVIDFKWVTQEEIENWLSEKPTDFTYDFRELYYKYRANIFHQQIPDHFQRLKARTTRIDGHSNLPSSSL